MPALPPEADSGDAVALGVRPAGSQGSLALYILLRLMVGLALLVIAAFVVPGDVTLVESAGIEYTLAAVLFGAMGVSAALLRRHGHRPAFAWSQVIIDAVFVAMLVLATGGARSPYMPMFFMNIVASAWLLPPRGPIAVGGLDALAFIGMILAQGSDFVEAGFGGDSLLAYTQALLYVLGFFLVGMLSGLLSQKVRATRRELADQVEQKERLQERHDVVLGRMDAGVVLAGADGVIYDLNLSARELLGEVEGQQLGELLRLEERTWEQPFDQEGNVLQILCSRSRLPDGDQVVLIEDLTALREMEAVVQRDERLAAVGRLAAGLAHEIRNPLASLSGSIQLLRDEHPSPLHGILMREVQRLNDLVEEFLFSARPVRLEVEPVDPGPIIADVVVAFKNDGRYHSREVVVDLDPDLPRTRLDAARLRQVLWNLALNAAQATAEGGLVKLTARGEGEHLVIEVIDDGVGIPSERLSRIFDPFHTTRAGGTGLGLANVERVVRAHGGFVGVRSVPGEGTRFTLHLPVVGPAGGGE